MTIAAIAARAPVPKPSWNLPSSRRFAGPTPGCRRAGLHARIGHSRQGRRVAILAGYPNGVGVAPRDLVAGGEWQMIERLAAAAAQLKRS
jgi:hypothetical protein